MIHVFAETFTSTTSSCSSTFSLPAFGYVGAQCCRTELITLIVIRQDISTTIC